MSPAVFTPQELAEVVAYHRPGYVFAAVAEVMDIAVLAVLLRFCARPFYRWAEAGAAALARRGSRVARTPVLRTLPAVMTRLWGGSGWGSAILFATLLSLALNLFFLPLDIYFGYVLEHRHGLSNQSAAAFALGALTDWLSRLGGKVMLLIGMYGLMRRLKRWWAWLGAVAALLLLVSGMLDPLVVGLTNDMRPLPPGPLRERLVGLMARTGLEFHDIVVERTSLSSKKVAAWFIGQGPTRTIVLSDTMVAAFPEEEIEAVVAHEAGHLRERKLSGRISAAVTLVAFLFLVDRLFRLGARRGWLGATSPTDVRTMPLLSVASFALFFLGQPISAAFSRELEREADRYALALTHRPEAFQSMLIRVARMNKLDPSPPAWLVLKGETHPTIAERLEMAEREKK